MGNLRKLGKVHFTIFSKTTQKIFKKILNDIPILSLQLRQLKEFKKKIYLNLSFQINKNHD